MASDWIHCTDVLTGAQVALRMSTITRVGGTSDGAAIYNGEFYTLVEESYSDVLHRLSAQPPAAVGIAQSVARRPRRAVGG